MTLLCVLVICSAVFVSGNEDVSRDLVYGNYKENDVDVARRALMESLGLKNLAGSFASQIGTVSKAAVDSSSKIGILPWRPIVIPTPTRVVDSCLGYIGAIGKREESYSNALEKRATDTVKMVNRDFVFILDTSGSILGSEFSLAKEAIASLLQAFCPLKFGHEVTAEGTKQMAMVLFGSRVTRVINFEDSHKGLDAVQEKIMSVKHQREGMTSTASALNYVKEAILGQGLSRLNNPKVSTDVIIITDGRCNRECKNLAKEAEAIRGMGHGVNIFAVGVAQARECELDIISGKSSGTKAYGLSGMKSFEMMAEKVMEEAQASDKKCV